MISHYLSTAAEFSDQPPAINFRFFELARPARAVKHRQRHFKRVMLPGAVLPVGKITIRFFEIANASLCRKIRL
jgi:hypothetical protein